MTANTVADAMSEFASAMVGEHDIAGTLSDILSNCARVCRADACGILIKDGNTGLQLLGATSHRVEELELYQAQIFDGPCAESVRSGKAIHASAVDVVAQWPSFGARMVDAGFGAVAAVPMRWHHRSFGALNLFFESPRTVSQGDLTTMKAFADLSSILLVHVDEVDTQEAGRRVRVALETRTVIEQAKGVLSHRNGIDMAEAYRVLVSMATEHQLPLSLMAIEIIGQAQTKR